MNARRHLKPDFRSSVIFFLIFGKTLPNTHATCMRIIVLFIGTNGNYTEKWLKSKKVTRLKLVTRNVKRRES